MNCRVSKQSSKQRKKAAAAGEQFHDLYPRDVWPKSQAKRTRWAKFYSCRGAWGNFRNTRKGRRTTRYFFPKNFPNPNRTCTVFTPGFGDVSPAFETCMYRRSTDQVCSPRKCIPNAAPDVKFMVEVPVGTSYVVNSVPPFNSM